VAIRVGYYQDEALVTLLANTRNIPHREPLMLRGYYLRNYIMRDIVRKFLSTEQGSFPKKQIVNLGAGFDTLYFWIKKQNLFSPDMLYFELDFMDVLKHKVESLSNHPTLLAQIGSPDEIVLDLNSGSLRSANYNIIPGDLRYWDDLVSKMRECNFDPSVPTLYLSECVLIYMQAEFSQSIISWIAENSDVALFACYEQIKPNDAFGKMMIENLDRRGCSLQGLRAFPTEQSQINRFLSVGWTKAECYNMNILYQQYLPAEERRRVERLQMLDEIEEWFLINDHYCIAWSMVNKQTNPEWDKLVFLNPR